MRFAGLLAGNVWLISRIPSNECTHLLINSHIGTMNQEPRVCLSVRQWRVFILNECPGSKITWPTKVYATTAVAATAAVDGVLARL